MSQYSRRDFLKTAGLFGGGLVMAPSLFAQAAAPKASANEQINVALVGMGKEGEVLLNNLLKIPGLNFRAVCDIQPSRQRYAAVRIRSTNRERYDELPKKHVYEDYKDLLANEKDLDAVIIATPDFWHAPQTVDFLNAGVNVYCEKMMSNTVEGARSMVHAARKSGKLLQIGHQRKSNPRYHFVRDVLLRKHNLCGTLTNANGQWNRAVAKDLELPANAKLDQKVLEKYGYENEHKFCNWRWYKGLGGGPISDLGAHQIDIFAYMFGGRPISVMAGGGVDFYEGKDWYDNVMCIYEFNTYQGKKARAFYQVLTTTSAGGGYFEQFMGTEGAIKISENPSLTKIFAEPKNDEKILAKWDALVQEKALRSVAAAEVKIADVRESAQLKEYALPAMDIDKDPAFIHMPHLVNFFNAIRGKEKLTCDGEHAFEAEAAVFKVNQAVEEKKMLMFEESDFIA